MAAPEPWWQNNPEIRELTRRALAEIEDAADDPTRGADADGPDPVVEELFSGACMRALANARDNLSSARAEYDGAVRKARVAGLSWGEIGAVLGVSKQRLHSQFRQHR